MIVIHGNWVKGRLWLWGEWALQKKPSCSSLNPFSLPPNYLAAVVKAFAGGLNMPRLRVRHVRKVKGCLPSFQGFPQPSVAYLAPSDWPMPTDGKYEIAAVEVYALPLSYKETSHLFRNIISLPKGENRFTKEVTLGNDIVALSRIWKFAAATIARESVLPGVAGVRSRWLPVLSKADEDRLTAIATAVPRSAFCLEDASLPLDFFDEAVDLQMRHGSSTLLTRRAAQCSKFYDCHSAFLASLRTPNSLVRWDNGKDLETLGLLLNKWREPLERVSSSVTLGFRLIDPKIVGGRNPVWILQPVIIDGERIIPLSKDALDALPANKARVILISLGQASLVIPGIPGDITGSVSVSGAVKLDAPHLYAFINDSAPELQAAGFPLFAPPWIVASRRRDGRPKLRAVTVTPKESGGLFALDSLVDIKWEVVLNGQSFDPKEIEWLLASDSPIISRGTSWIVLDKQKLLSAKQRLDKIMNKTVSLHDLVAFGVGAGGDGVDIDINESSLSDEIKSSGIQLLLSGRGKLERVPVPKGFCGKLRPYQRTGLDWLSFLYSWGLGACLADDMGLGKTIEAISIFLAARAGGMRLPILVVCPVSIMLKWHRELKTFAPRLKTWIYHGSERLRGEAFRKQIEKIDLCITCYPLLSKELAAIRSVEWGIVLADEAQNIKNPRTAKSRSVRSIDAKWRIALTGTPVENSVGDIWAIMDFINPGLLSDHATFMEKFQRPVTAGSNPEINEELKRLTSPFILRRLKTDPEIVSSMPAKVEEKVYCSLTKEQALLYGAEVKDAERGLYETNGVRKRGAILALLTRLKQICNHPAQYNHLEGVQYSESEGLIDSAKSGKLMRLDEMLDEIIANGEAALIFTQYAVMGHMLAGHLSKRYGFDVPFLHGEVPMKKRDEMVSFFQRPDGPPIFILSIKAGGTGLDLTRANHVFHYDRWWNPAVENQATDRAHRIGQSKTVFVHTFICEGTLESHIDDLIEGKLRLADSLMTNGDNWLSSLDDESLRKVIELSNDVSAIG